MMTRQVIRLTEGLVLTGFNTTLTITLYANTLCNQGFNAQTQYKCDLYEAYKNLISILEIMTYSYFGDIYL